MAWRVLQLIFIGIIVAIGGLALFLVLLRYADTIEKNIPWLARLMKRRDVLFALFAFAIGLLLKDFHDAIAVVEPPTVKILAPLVPQITVAAPHQITPRMQVEDSHGPVNGRVFYQDDAGNLNFPDPLSIRNIGGVSTQQLAVHVYFSEVVALSVRQYWESTGTGYDEFPFKMWVRANIQLNPREKWNIPTLQGKRANIARVKPIIVKMEVFYG